MENNIKVALGLPTNRLVKPKTAKSLLDLVNQTKHEYKIIVSIRGYNTAENRNYISAQAVNAGCDYIFMVDDDMIYEPDTLEKLLAHKKDIIGGMYFTKYEKQAPVIEYLDDERPEALFECGSLGGGLMLIKCDVFKKISQPWYGYVWNDNGSIKESNDWYFCHKAKDSGFKIWCDPEVKAKHIGQHEF